MYGSGAVGSVVNCGWKSKVSPSLNSGWLETSLIFVTTISLTGGVLAVKPGFQLRNRGHLCEEELRS